MICTPKNQTVFRVKSPRTGRTHTYLTAGAAYRFVAKEMIVGKYHWKRCGCLESEPFRGPCDFCKELYHGTLSPPDGGGERPRFRDFRDYIVSWLRYFDERKAA